MTAIVFTIPDDPDALPGWLEARLLGPDLGRLVAELTAVHGPPAARDSLAAVLGDSREQMLTAGLRELPRAMLSRLLRQPDLLPELQAMVLNEGGPYWDRVAGDPAAADRVADRVMRAVAADLRPAPPRRRAQWALAGYTATALATAAAVLTAVYLGGFRRPAGEGQLASAAGWGFAKVNELPRGAGDAVTFARLADLAGEWTSQRPEDAPSLARRLSEFRQGCSALLLAEDLPLSAPGKEWLRLRCGDWAAAIDAHLRQLEDTRGVAAVRAAADATVGGIARELRDRAEASHPA